VGRRLLTLRLAILVAVPAIYLGTAAGADPKAGAMPGMCPRSYASRISRARAVLGAHHPAIRTDEMADDAFACTARVVVGRVDEIPLRRRTA
jgi:hypothetical protein